MTKPYELPKDTSVTDYITQALALDNATDFEIALLVTGKSPTAKPAERSRAVHLAQKLFERAARRG